MGSLCALVITLPCPRSTIGSENGRDVSRRERDTLTFYMAWLWPLLHLLIAMSSWTAERLLSLNENGVSRESVWSETLWIAPSLKWLIPTRAALLNSGISSLGCLTVTNAKENQFNMKGWCDGDFWWFGRLLYFSRFIVSATRHSAVSLRFLRGIHASLGNLSIRKTYTKGKCIHTSGGFKLHLP